MRSTIRCSLAGVVALAWVSGCVTSGTHETVLAQLDKTKKELTSTREELDKVRGERGELSVKLATAGRKQDEQEAMLASMNMSIQKLSGEKVQLTDRQQKLQQEIAALSRMRQAAERRNAEFRSLLEKLKTMMDAGTLEVKPRNGLLVVQMSSDVVFAPASTRIKEEARDALFELAQTLATFEGRRFQVVGHCDNVPIRSARFPSNWELSAARAVEVVKLLIEAGVQPEMIGAAGNAEFDPLVDNETPENRTINRRVEIVFLPRIDELPGFDKVLSGS